MDPDQTARYGSSADTKAGTPGAGDDGEALSRRYIGRTLGTYQVLREVGRGSMGIVFEAMQPGLNRRVAVKVLPPSLSVTETVIRRFLREAQSVARLSHDNIVQIHEIGEDAGINYYVMQFIEGQSLDRVLRERKFTPKESARIAAQSARALFFAHENGIIHRDVKPANIILTYKDKPVLTDFGLARPEKAATLTESGALVGTPIYMSPEQVRGDRSAIDRRTDIYSLGVTLYEMLCNHTPFDGTSTQDILRKIEEEEPRPLRRLNPDVPKALAVIVHKAMEKDASRRYQTAIEMALDLERFLADEPIQARPTGLRTRLARRARRHKVITALAVLLTITSVLTLISLQAGRRNRAEVDRLKYDQLLRDGVQAFEQGSDAKAIEKLGAAIALNPDITTAYVERGRAYVKASRYEEALADFQHVLDREPGNDRARWWRGLVRVQVGSSEECDSGFRDIRDALNASPDDKFLLREMAWMYLTLPQANKGANRETFTRGAQSMVTKLLTADPNDDAALVLQGMLYEEEGIHYRDPDLIAMAFDNYKKAREINRNNLRAWKLLDRPQDRILAPPRPESADEGTAAIRPSPWWSALASEGLTWASSKVDLRADVLDHAVNILFSKPGPDGAASPSPKESERIEELMTRAGDLWNAGNQPAAAKLYVDVLAIDASVVDARNRLVEYNLLPAHRDLVTARWHAERALKDAPSDLRTLMLAFKVYGELGASDKMREVVQLAAQSHPSILSIPQVQEFLAAQQPEAPDEPPANVPGGDG